MRDSRSQGFITQRNLRLRRGPVGSTGITFLAMLSIGWWLVTPADARDLPLPAGTYPPHTRLTYYPTWTNHQLDCNFGWVCEGGNLQPIFHLSTEDVLHRTGGWAIWGEWHDDRMGFELYSSVYADQTTPGTVFWNRYAAADEQMTLRGLQRAKRLQAVPSVLPDGVAGGSFAASLDRPYWHVLFLTAWWGPTHEIEAAVLYPLKQKRTAWHYLTEEVRAAVQVSESSK